LTCANGKEVVTLGDFGISRVLHGCTDFAITAVGTPCYLSPEVCKGVPYSQKCDVWALGCVMYEMAALQPAFKPQNGSLELLVQLIVHAQYVITSDLAVAYPTVVKVVRILLQLAPARRPSAASLLAKEPLRGLLGSIGPVASACSASRMVGPANRLAAEMAVPHAVSARNRRPEVQVPKAMHFSARAQMASRILEAEAQDRLAQQAWADCDPRLLGVVDDARRVMPEKRHGSKMLGRNSVDAFTMAASVQHKADVLPGPPTAIPCPQGAHKPTSGGKASPRPQTHSTGRTCASEAALLVANSYESPLEVPKRTELSIRREQRDQQRQEFLSWMRSQRRQRRQVNDEQGKCKEESGLTAADEVGCIEDNAAQQLQANPAEEMDVAALPGSSTSMGEHLEELRASLEEQLGTQRFRSIYQSIMEAGNPAVCVPQMDCKEVHAVAGLVERDRLFFHVGLEVQAL